MCVRSNSPKSICCKMREIACSTLRVNINFYLRDALLVWVYATAFPSVCHMHAFCQNYYYHHSFTALWILSRTTQVSRYEKGKTNLDFLVQETVSGSGIHWAICKSVTRPRQNTMPTPHHSVSKWLNISSKFFYHLIAPLF